MPAEPSYYTPERINTILRNWARYQSQAEGFRSLAADALRPARGKRGDHLAAADIVADLERALVAVISYGSVEWKVTIHVMQGHTLTHYADTQHHGKGRTLEAYDVACQRLACYLGWEDDLRA